MAKVKDLTGMKFGRLTVIKRAMDKKYSIPHWICQCECGNVKTICGNNLKSGATQSCGCWSSEKMKEKWENEDYRKMRSEKMKEKWENEDYRKMRSEKVKEQWQDKDFRKMRSKQVKQQWENEEFRKMRSEKMKEKWQDEDFRKMHIEKCKEQTGDKNPNYKGGISTISDYLRGLQIVKQWRKDTYTRENSKCQLTGKHVHGGNSDVHHLYGFNTIVKEAHDLHNIQIKEIVSDYTEEELKLLEDYIIKQHENTDNAVLLCDELHMLFHKPKKDGGYGKGNNTPEQFEEFKERYLAGEFKEILK